MAERVRGALTSTNTVGSPPPARFAINGFARVLSPQERRNFVPPPRTGRYEVKEREAREVVLPMESAARTGTSMKRVLLSLLAIGGVFYPAFVFFAGNDANPSGDELKLAGQSASSEQATRPDITAVEQAQAAEKPDGADVMAPAVPNSRHAITVERGLSPAPSKTQSPAPAETQSQAPAQAQPQAAAEPSPAPAPQASPPKPEGGTLPSTQSTEASPDAKPSQPEFVKVTSPASVRKGPSASSAIIGIAHTSAEAQVVSRDGDWVQIIDPDSKKAGWIQQSFLVPQTAPSSRPASQQAIDAALATPPEDTTASADNEPSAKSKSHKHGSNHRRHRRAFAWGFIFRHAW